MKYKVVAAFDAIERQNATNVVAQKYFRVQMPARRTALNACRSGTSQSRQGAKF